MEFELNTEQGRFAGHDTDNVTVGFWSPRSLPQFTEEFINAISESDKLHLKAMFGDDTDKWLREQAASLWVQSFWLRALSVAAAHEIRYSGQ